MARAHKTFIHDEVELKTDMTPKAVDKDEFGKRLSKLLLERGWNQSDFGRRAGLQRALVSAYINGRNFPTPQSLYKMAAALGMSPEELLPNYARDAIEEDDKPAFEMKSVAGSPDTMWLRVNQMVTLDQALAIGELLKRAKSTDRK